jgi:hypothetical protein
MTRNDVVPRLALQNDAATLAQAAAARTAAELLMRSAGTVTDDAVSALVGSFRLLVLRAVNEAAPGRLSRQALARLRALEQLAERQEPQ